MVRLWKVNLELVGPLMQPDPYIEFLENWIPGIGECTELHDQLHEHFRLGFSVNEEARLLGFQLGHHPAGNFFHVIAFSALSLTIYPKSYRNTWKDVKDFYLSYLLGRNWQFVPYWYIPRNILEINHGNG